MDIETLRKKGDINRQLINEYLAQIKVVNTIVDSYKLSMEVARAISNITIMSTEINNINAQNSVLRASALVKLADNEVEFKKVELAIKQILDADIAYGKVLLEKEMAELDRLIAISNEELSVEEHNIAGRQADSVRVNITARVNAFYDLVVSQLTNMELNSTEDRAVKERALEKINLSGITTREKYITNATVKGDKIRRDINALNQNPRQHYLAQLTGDQTIFDAELEAAENLTAANVTQTLNHTIT